MRESTSRSIGPVLLALSLCLAALGFLFFPLALQPPTGNAVHAQDVAPGGDDIFTDAIQVAAGDDHGCALTRAGAVYCWGEDVSLRPQAVAGLTSGVKRISANGQELAGCALLSDDSVRCWGSNYWGELGIGNTDSQYEPVEPIGLGTGVRSISVGDGTVCAVTAQGAAKCWGTGTNGQLGNGASDNKYVPTQVAGLESGVASIAVGGGHACAILDNGSVRCWGNNFSGALGDGTETERSSPVAVSGLSSGAKSLGLGDKTSCVVMQDGAVKCWGEGTGAFDGYEFENSLTPRDIPGLPEAIISVTTGGEWLSDKFFCALTVSGGAWCWGENSYGALGDGTTISRSDPAPVFGMTSGVTSIDGGVFSACATHADGKASCWGSRGRGALGDGQDTIVWPPTAAAAFGSVQEIAIGSDHACALTTAGGVKCAGVGMFGVLGDGTELSRIEPEFALGLESGVAHVYAADEALSCALLVSGEARCWGYNLWYGIGIEPIGGEDIQTSYLTPTTVMNLPAGASMLAPSNRHHCALTPSGGVKCWGKNEYGQVGDGSVEDRQSPVDVVGLTSGVKMVETSSDIFMGEQSRRSCALTNGGGVKCWGENSTGYLGDGTTMNRSVPTDVIGLGSGVKQIAMDTANICVLTTQGGVKCWGTGPVGDGTEDERTVPTDVSGLQSGVAAITVGQAEMCAVMESGGVKCWGRASGQENNDVYRPSDIPNLGGKATSVALGRNRGCAVIEGDALRCWGYFGAELGRNPGWYPVYVIAPLVEEEPTPTATPMPPVPQGTPFYLPSITGRR